MRSNIWIVNNTVYGCGRTDWYGGSSFKHQRQGGPGPQQPVRLQHRLANPVRAGATSETLVTHNLIASFRDCPVQTKSAENPASRPIRPLSGPRCRHFRLKYGSPALDQGADVSWLTHVFPDVPRTAPPDIGAYEYDPDGTDSDFDHHAGRGGKSGSSVNPTKRLNAGGDSTWTHSSTRDEYGRTPTRPIRDSILRRRHWIGTVLCWTGGSNVFQSLEKSDTLFSNDWKTVFTNRPPTPLTKPSPARM
jgi:hypothetical protein